MHTILNPTQLNATERDMEAAIARFTHAIATRPEEFDEFTRSINPDKSKIGEEWVKLETMRIGRDFRYGPLNHLAEIHYWGGGGLGIKISWHMYLGIKNFNHTYVAFEVPIIGRGLTTPFVVRQDYNNYLNKQISSMWTLPLLYQVMQTLGCK